ncbi:hypothetical protein [Streptomyces sp. NBC_00258]|uniref:hypothetical protein n=1 Tax=Streptomyces sp. NBC_00258 TaxID=2903642 RepID=UPI002E2DBDAC|nr:hypothetical protein [Streptomyces sp. NBC_00258]
MKWILLGALLGLCLLYPSLLAVVLAVVAAVLSKPLLVAFGLGLAVGARSPLLRRRTR